MAKRDASAFGCSVGFGELHPAERTANRIVTIKSMFFFTNGTPSPNKEAADGYQSNYRLPNPLVVISLSIEYYSFFHMSNTCFQSICMPFEHWFELESQVYNDACQKCKEHSECDVEQKTLCP